MLQENLLKIYETSFRENREMSALTDYFKNETFSYYDMAKEIHLTRFPYNDLLYQNYDEDSE